MFGRRKELPAEKEKGPVERVYTLYKECSNLDGEIPEKFYFNISVSSSDGDDLKDVPNTADIYGVTSRLINKGYRLNCKRDTITTIPANEIKGNKFLTPVDLETLVKFRQDFKEATKTEVLHKEGLVN